jgi:hypothetical protein
MNAHKAVCVTPVVSLSGKQRSTPGDPTGAFTAAFPALAAPAVFESPYLVPQAFRADRL